MTIYTLKKLELETKGVATSEKLTNIAQVGNDGDQVTKEICLFILSHVEVGMRIDEMDLLEYRHGGYFFHLFYSTSSTHRIRECLDLPKGWTIPPYRGPAFPGRR